MIPIVFVRQFSPVSGNWSGIPIALKQAKKVNPDGRVIFLADEKQPAEYRQIAEWVPMEHYSKMKERLAKAWPFHGCQDEWFLWASLSNWLVAAEWAINNNEEFICVLDCDVLLFCDVTKECQHWRQFDVCACNPCGTMQAPTFVKRSALMEFAGWLLGVYEKTINVNNTVWSESKCCMSAWRHFLAARLDLKFGNLCDVVDGGTWDHNSGMDYGGYAWNGTGRIYEWERGQPIGCKAITENGNTYFDFIRFRALHMWGPFKGRMGEFVKASEESE
jgi:hypothetical protein